MVGNHFTDKLPEFRLCIRVLQIKGREALLYVPLELPHLMGKATVRKPILRKPIFFSVYMLHFCACFNGFAIIWKPFFFLFTCCIYLHGLCNHTEADFGPFLCAAFLCVFGILFLYVAFTLMGSATIWNPILFPFYIH